MTPEDYETTIKKLEKEIRVLKKKLERSETDSTRLEETNQNRESLLKKVICELQEYQGTLEKKSIDLEQAFNELNMMQDKLVEARKMAALGSLVAGIAHEINTPVGTSITLASTLADETQLLLAAVGAGQLRRSLLNNYLEIAEESTSLLLSNLNRAGELVQSFKQVAVDQSILEQRTFRVKHYLEEVITSLSPQFRYTSHRVTVKGDDEISIHSYSGAIAQVATNLVTNSLAHAYSNGESGQLCFDVTQENEYAIIKYSDDGCGIEPEVLGKIFEPFFSTARGKGGTGLGLNIVYNLVTQKLLGRIDVQSEVGKGTQST
ncbi:MAG: sensor histidine kinase [Pseudanabaena sp. SU_2_4]|nr:sensor histidine kinase [Pseudanabaena sp. SU_2_4]